MQPVIVLLLALPAVLPAQASGLEPRLRRITHDPAQEGFPSWSSDGETLVFSRTDRDPDAKTLGLWKTLALGGEPSQFTSVIGEHPHWSPDGHYIAFDGDHGNSVQLVSAGGGSPIRVVHESIPIQRGGNPVWSRDGARLAFREGENLRVLDLRTGKVEVVFARAGKHPLPCSWVPDGTAIVTCVRDLETRTANLWAVSLTGEENVQLTFDEAGACRYADVSPDGSLLVFASVLEGGCDLWIMPTTGGRPIRVTSHPEYDDTPRWSPDGEEIAFTSTRSGNFDVWILDVDRDATERELEDLNE